MTDAAVAAPTLDGLGDVLQALQAEGLHRHDPARFHYLQVLAARVPGQPVAVQEVLLQKLCAAAADYSLQARLAPFAPSFVPPVEGSTAPLKGSALAQLNRELRARTQENSDATGSGDARSVSEMKSVRQFAHVWSQISADRQVVDALARGPQNAGPLNSHRLVLRSLALMRTLSPQYLQHFLSQMDTLLALEQMNTRPLRSAARSGRRARPKP